MRPGQDARVRPRAHRGPVHRGRWWSARRGMAGDSTGEVFRAHLVEELPELLDLVLLLVRDDDPGLVQHRVGAPDGGADPQCQRDRVAGPGGDPQAVTEE